MQTFYTRLWEISDKVKSTIKNQDTLHNENTNKYKEIHTHTHTQKIDASFAHKIKEQISFKHGIWGTS